MSCDENTYVLIRISEGMSWEDSVKISEFQYLMAKRHANLTAKTRNSETKLQIVTMIGAAKWTRNIYFTFPRWEGKRKKL